MSMKSYHCKSAFGCNECVCVCVSCLMMRSVLSARGSQMKNHCYSHAMAMQQQSQGHLIAGDRVAISMPSLLFMFDIIVLINGVHPYHAFGHMALGVQGYSWLSEQSSDFCPAESNPAWRHWLWAATETGTESCNLAKDFIEGGEALDLQIGE